MVHVHLLYDEHVVFHTLLYGELAVFHTVLVYGKLAVFHQASSRCPPVYMRIIHMLELNIT